MRSLEKPSKPLTVDADVIVKLDGLASFRAGGSTIFNANQGLYISTKEFVDKLIYHITKSFSHEKLFKEGIEIAVLEPGKPWSKGKIRFNISYEFIPDEPELISESPLDDIRKTMNG